MRLAPVATIHPPREFRAPPLHPIPLIWPTSAESMLRVAGPQFSDLFWPVACGLWDLFFKKAAGGTRVEGVIKESEKLLLM